MAEYPIQKVIEELVARIQESVVHPKAYGAIDVLSKSHIPASTVEMILKILDSHPNLSLMGYSS